MCRLCSRLARVGHACLCLSTLVSSLMTTCDWISLASVDGGQNSTWLAVLCNPVKLWEAGVDKKKERMLNPLSFSFLLVQSPHPPSCFPICMGPCIFSLCEKWSLWRGDEEWRLRMKQPLLLPAPPPVASLCPFCFAYWFIKLLDFSAFTNQSYFGRPFSPSLCWLQLSWITGLLAALNILSLAPPVQRKNLCSIRGFT